MIDQIGIIGAGKLAGFLVAGLRKADPGLRILLSDPDPQRAGLAFRWGAEAVPGNQELADSTELVLLAVRPEQAMPACAAVVFHATQVVASAVAGLPLARLQAAVAPAQAVRVMPLSSAALNESPTLLYPEHAEVHALFALLGRVHPMPDETGFTSASAAAAFYGWMFALVDDMVVWTTQAGVPSATARSLVLETVRSAAGMALAQPDRQLGDMLKELATPGGITEHGLQVLRQRQGLASWTEAMDAVLEKLQPT